jgi:hypothetical protein
MQDVENAFRLTHVEHEYDSPSLEEDVAEEAIDKLIGDMAIINALSWLGTHRRNFLDFILDGFPPERNFKLFEDEEDTVALESAMHNFTTHYDWAEYVRMRL